MQPPSCWIIDGYTSSNVDDGYWEGINLLQADIVGFQRAARRKGCLGICKVLNVNDNIVRIDIDG